MVRAGADVESNANEQQLACVVASTRLRVAADAPSMQRHHFSAGANPSHYLAASAMHRDGAIVLKKTLLQLDKILFDSGAIHASYIDPKLVAKYRKMLEPFIRPITGSVTLGDAKTTHSVSEVVTLKLSFVDDDLEEHRGTVELVVFESGSHIIIGLPDIARTFGDLFIKMIRKAMKNPAMFRQSKLRPSAQAVVNHSFWARQSLLMLSGSDPADKAANLDGVKLVERDEYSSDSDEYQF